MYNAASPSVSVTDARAHLRDILARVESGEEITITRNGQAVAVMMSPQRVRHRRRTPLMEEAERFHREMEELRSNPPRLDELPDEGWLTSEDVERLIAEIRADRDRD